MKTEWVSVAKLFGGDDHVQYRIPLYQRLYVWDDKVWGSLWKDITDKVESNRGKNTDDRKRHFTGAIVTQKQNTKEGEVAKYEVIDGQQRLTTFQIILCAIREICKHKEYTAVKTVEKFILNYDYFLTNFETEKYKLYREESKTDESDFLLIVDGDIEKCQGGNVLEAYVYFYKRIKTEYARDNEEMLSLFTTISQDFGVVRIEVDSNDDESEKIFASLNTAGKLLSEFDHLRNYLFLRARTSEEDEDSNSVRKSIYKQYWKHFEEDQYWSKPEEKADEFLEVFLITKLGPGSIESTLFDTYQRNLAQLHKNREVAKNANLEVAETAELVVSEFAQLRKASEVYQEEINSENLIAGHRMEFFQEFEFNDWHPFLLFVINESNLSEDQIDQVFKIIESYALRRLVCYGASQARKIARINTFFEKFFPEDSVVPQFNVGEFIEQLNDSKYTKWPTDPEVEEALADIGKAPQVARYILYRIERWQRENDALTETIAVPSDQFTLEHIMPTSWRRSWPLSIGDGDELLFGDLYTPAHKRDNPSTWYARPDPKGLKKPSYRDAHDLAARRKGVVQSIGNLTIVTEKLNRDGLANKPFVEKKELLVRHSDLRLNRLLCANYDSWDADEICQRATTIMEHFCEIWPSAEVFIERITGQNPKPKARPDWISGVESNAYQFATRDGDLMSLSQVEVTSEFDVTGINKEGRKISLEQSDIFFVIPRAAADIISTTREEREKLRNGTSHRALRVWDRLLRLSQEQQVGVVLKTLSMHEFAGIISKYDDDAIYMKIGEHDVIVFRHSIFEFAIVESFDGEVESWGTQRYGFIKCTSHKEWDWRDDFYVEKGFLNEGINSLIQGQKVKFNVQIVLKSGRPRLEARNVVLGETELYDGEILNWRGAFGFIKSSNFETNVFVHTNDILAKGETSPRQGQKVKFNVAESAKGSERRLQAYNVALVEELYEGMVKSFNPQKGYGLIQFNQDQSEEVKDRRDVFVHISDVQDNKPLKIGQTVKFSIEFSKKHSKQGRSEARNVVLVETQELHHGIVKWVDSTKRFGRLVSNSHQSDPPDEIYVHVTQFPDNDINSLQPGYKVEYTLINTERGLQACNVVVLEKSDESKTKPEPLYCGELETDWMRDYDFNFIIPTEPSLSTPKIKVKPEHIRSEDVFSLKKGQKLQFNLNETKREARNVVLVDSQPR